MNFYDFFLEKTIDSAIWVNKDQTAFLIYRCPANGRKGYKVLSKTETLKAEDIEIIKEKIIDLGFTPEYVAYMNYDL